MDNFSKPKCPVNGGRATKFANVAVANEKPESGGQSLFVMQCEHGHIIAPDIMTKLRSLLDRQHKLLVRIIEKIEVDV
jgi:hypothetical protein